MNEFLPPPGMGKYQDKTGRWVNSSTEATRLGEGQP